MQMCATYIDCIMYFADRQLRTMLCINNRTQWDTVAFVYCSHSSIVSWIDIGDPTSVLSRNWNWILSRFIKKKRELPLMISALFFFFSTICYGIRSKSSHSLRNLCDITKYDSSQISLCFTFCCFQRDVTCHFFVTDTKSNLRSQKITLPSRSVLFSQLFPNANNFRKDR